MGGSPLDKISASYFKFLSNPILPLLSQRPTPNSSPKFIFCPLLAFKPQHPLKSKEISITLLLLSSKPSTSLGSLYTPPKTTETIRPSSLWVKTGFFKGKGDFLLTLILKSLELACRLALTVPAPYL